MGLPEEHRSEVIRTSTLDLFQLIEDSFLPLMQAALNMATSRRDLQNFQDGARTPGVFVATSTTESEKGRYAYLEMSVYARGR